jgi:hypothetical protein
MQAVGFWQILRQRLAYRQISAGIQKRLPGRQLAERLELMGKAGRRQGRY